jgi:DNA-binding transcriptional MerR regulator
VLANRSYSVAELQDLSGFDRRTIVYYIQQGLVARPGRRGPNTRYPQAALARLQFTRGVKELQTRGHLLNVTLNDIRRVIDRLGPEKVQLLVSRSMPPEEIEPLFAEPSAIEPEPVGPTEPVIRAALASAPPTGDRRFFGLADAGIRRRFMGEKQPAPPPLPATLPDRPVPEQLAMRPDETPIPTSVADAPPADPVDLANLGDMLRQLEIRPSMTGKRLPPGASEHWTEIPITSRVYLSVRGLSADDAPLADAVARAMKKLLRVR